MGEGLPAKEWNALLDCYLTTKKIPIENLDWEALSDIQRIVINEIKKSYARTNRKEHE